MKTVWAYVDTSKQVGDPDHLKVFANADAAERGPRKTIPKALPSSARFWNDSHRRQHCVDHVALPHQGR